MIEMWFLGWDREHRQPGRCLAGNQLHRAERSPAPFLPGPRIEGLQFSLIPGPGVGAGIAKDARACCAFSRSTMIFGESGLLPRDVVSTKDDVDGLMAGLLTSDAMRLENWLCGDAYSFGRYCDYMPELRWNCRF